MADGPVLLLLFAGVSAVPAIVFAAVGRTVGRRRVERETRVAHIAVQAWWYGLALLAAAESAQLLAGALSVRDPSLYVLLLDLSILGFVLAMWGLLRHVLHIHGAPRGLLRTVSVLAALAYLALHYVRLRSPVEDVVVERWGVQLVVTTDISGTLIVATGLLILAPALAGVVGYAMLYRHLEGRAQRARVALVSIGLFAWVAGSVVAGILSEGGAREVTDRALELLFAGFVLLAYYPPRLVRERLGLDPAAARTY